MYKSLPEETEQIAAAIVDAAFQVHNELGPGLLEKVYETCLDHELRKHGFECDKEVAVPIEYDGITFDEGLRLDLFVENKVIVELKAVDQFNPVWEAQVLSYLKMTDNRLGLLINFNVPLIKDGIKRLIN